MKQLLLALSILAMAAGCTTNTSKKASVFYPSTPLPAETPVEVIGLGQKAPEGATLIGSLKIGDGWTRTKFCTYDRVIADAQVQARGMGGNLIQITEHRDPDMWSTCHRIKADVYLVK